MSRQDAAGEEIDIDDINISTNGNLKNNNTKSKVDINVLLNKVRAENKKEKFENYILLSLVGVLIAVSGIIISL